MRSTGRVTALVIGMFLSAGAAGLVADTGAGVLDREVVVVGEDLVVLAAPDPAGWALVEIPDLDLTLPAFARDPPLSPPPPAPIAPSARQVLALMEVSDV